MAKQRSGYTKNVVSYVEYDKNVDEGPTFSIKDPFKTTNVDHYYAPPEPPIKTNEINVMVDSAFTRTPPTFKVTDDGSHQNPFSTPTTTKSDFDARRIRYKDPKFAKEKILPSESAYLSNEAHVKGFGTEVDERERFKRASPIPPPDWRDYTATHMSEDGYTRSHHGNILVRAGQASNLDDPDATNLSKEGMDRIRRKDPAMWLRCQDPEWRESTSKIVYRPPHPMSATLSLFRSAAAIGTKEPQGSVRNNKATFADGHDPNPVDRFATETGIKYTPPTTTTNLSTLRCDHMTTSGFVRGNKMDVTLDAPSDEDYVRAPAELYTFIMFST
ncbi:hypothetical protein HK104_008468 [Borealophlyctis nickersoniae]|nr:hypothetical protein HK104_008468 [Borealophlyctis nickersoniae]